MNPTKTILLGAAVAAVAGCAPRHGDFFTKANLVC